MRRLRGKISLRALSRVLRRAHARFPNVFLVEIGNRITQNIFQSERGAGCGGRKKHTQHWLIGHAQRTLLPVNPSESSTGKDKSILSPSALFLQSNQDEKPKPTTTSGRAKHASRLMKGGVQETILRKRNISLSRDEVSDALVVEDHVVALEVVL